MSWANDYVGVPYELNGRGNDAVDCWGLVGRVYIELLGVVLPNMSDGYVSLLAGRRQLAEGLTRPHTMKHFVEGMTPEEFDIVLVASGKTAHHVGVVAPNSMVLHTQQVASEQLHLSRFREQFQPRDLRFFRCRT